MYAQYIAAQAFNSGGLGIIHSISHAVSAFYDTHHGLNNAIALPRVWAFNMPVAYQRFADIAEAMGIDTHGMTEVQAAEAALAAAHPAAARRGHPGAVHRRQAGQLLEEPARPGPDEVLRERAGRSPVTRRTSTASPTTSSATPARPGNAKECTFETVRPVVDHCMNGDLDDLLS